MQRLFISRQLRRCAVCTLGGHMKLATMARAASAPQSLGGCGMCKRGALSYGVRWSSGEVHEEQPARSGQYLLNKNDVLTRVLEVVKNFEKVDASKVTPESHFINDLGLNSLDVVEVVFAIEQEFILDIPDHDAEKIQSIPDAVEYIAQNPMAK